MFMWSPGPLSYQTASSTPPTTADSGSSRLPAAIGSTATDPGTWPHKALLRIAGIILSIVTVSIIIVILMVDDDYCCDYHSYYGGCYDC